MLPGVGCQLVRGHYLCPYPLTAAIADELQQAQVTYLVSGLCINFLLLGQSGITGVFQSVCGHKDPLLSTKVQTSRSDFTYSVYETCLPGR